MKKLVALMTNAWVIGAFSIVLAIQAGFADMGTVQMWSFVLINILLAQSINLLTGITGQISLGHAGFFAIGAYVCAIAMKVWGIPFPLAFVLAMTVTGAVGYVLAVPSGRVREFYLAMMSLAFGFIVYELIREMTSVTGGIMGLRGIPSPQIGTLDLFGWKVDSAWYFRILLVFMLAVVVALRNFVKSHFGRALYAVHVSELAAGTLGISQSAAKRSAYAISGAIAGLAGAFYAPLLGYLTSESFSMARSVEVLVMSIVGGLGSLAGQVFGAIVFTYLPQKLQAFNDYQFMAYGLILVCAFTLLPKGIAGLLKTRTRLCKFEQEALEQGGKAEAPMTRHNTRSGADALLRVKDVTIEFGGLRALKGVSLELHRGTITALVGPNGSGKSTLVNVISGIYQPTSGHVWFKGQDIGGWPSYRVARVGITRTFQDPRNVPSFTVRENILMGANRLYSHGGMAAAVNSKLAKAEEIRFLRRVNALMEVAGLSSHADDIIGDLPYGTQRLAEVARALASDPELLMLDEPAAGLSENETEQLIRLIRLACENGVAVMVIDHHMDFLDGLVNEVVVFEAGEEIYKGNMDGMRSNRKVIEAYLGTEELSHA